MSDNLGAGSYGEAKSASEPGGAAGPTGSAPAADAGVAPEFSDFKQLYTLLFCCTALFVAAVWLPIEGGFPGRPQPLDLYAKDSISGGFLAVFSAYGVLAGWMNVHRSKMIVWPAFFAAADGLYVCTTRGLQMPKLVPEDVKATMASQDWVRIYGSGFYVIALMSLLVVWTLFTGVLAGAKKEAARKEAAKAARLRS